ncbi:MAG: helix-turn-helix domain-containing protein [Bacteroidales bacterium]|nr:helix-turn-helix domain-containing protein [Bacteroidales bacterium]
MSKVLREITPLSEKDCFYVVDRHKKQFDYPVHQHNEFEINFIENAEGGLRIVGDSVETIGPYDLAMIGGDSLEHAWEQGTCVSGDIHEITIQFSRNLFSEAQLAKNQFEAIRKMFEAAENGIVFPMSTILRIYHDLEELVAEKDSFTQYLKFVNLLNALATSGPYRVLASSSFVHAGFSGEESRRIQKVKKYISEHSAEPIRQTDLADLVGMSRSAFSSFFKLRTGRTLSDYLIDIRLGNAARMLVDTNKSISEICYECGFNNLSNFNRIFKSRRGSTPREFRSIYKKNRIIV